MEHPTRLTNGDPADANEPFGPFEAWFAEARKSEPRDPDAMAIATVGDDGLPNVRMVLLKGWGPAGFVFFTNSESAKGNELARHPKAALVLYWKSLSRQFRARGSIEQVTAKEADDYFHSRARESRIGAWASQQSRPLESREVFEREVAERTQTFGDGPVPRPPHWLGYRLVPLEVEFWTEMPFRLHQRIQFRRAAPGGAWTKRRLYP